jgi:hypothetical protein
VPLYFTACIPLGNGKGLSKIDLEAIIMQKYIKYLYKQKNETKSTQEFIALAYQLSI